MKKFLSILVIILTFFIIYFLQANFFTWYTIAGVMPNLFIVLVLWIGLFIGKKTGVIFGFIFGIYLDFIIGQSIGISSVMFAIIGILGEYLDKSFSKDSRITIMLTVAASTAIYEIGIYVFRIIKFVTPIEIGAFASTLLIEILFNVVLVIILYPLIQKAGYYVENIFKSKTIMTRYF